MFDYYCFEDLDLIKYFIEYDADYTSKNYQAMYSLNMAITFNKVQTVKTILSKRLDLSGKNGSVMHTATRSGNEEILLILLQAGADINNRFDCYENTPLHTAVQEDNTNIIDFLVNHGACINSINKNGDTPIQLAVKYNHLNSVKALIKYLPNLETCDRQGFTPLYNAVCKKRIKIFKYLLNYGASVNGLYNEPGGILRYAAVTNNSAIINALINYNADPFYVDSQTNTTALSWYCYCNGYVLNKVTKILISFITLSVCINPLVKKLKGYMLSEECLQNSKVMKKYITKCNKELESMKHVLVCPQTSMFNILFYGYTNDCNALAKYSNSIKLALKKNNFKIYKNSIKGYLRKGIFRKKIMNPMIRYITSRTFLPYEISYRIVEHINNKELLAFSQ